MTPWPNNNHLRRDRVDSPVFYLLIDFRRYRRSFRPYRKPDIDELWQKQLQGSLFPDGEEEQVTKVLLVKAKVLPISCFPNKGKSETNEWRRKDRNPKEEQRYPSPPRPKHRPTVLLPPMQWSTSGSNSAPVVTTRIQDYDHQLSTPVLHAPPSAPSPGEVFYNSEDQSDVAFIVGTEEWRFPAHSFVLSRIEDTFQAFIREADRPIDTQKTDEGSEGQTKPSLVLKLPGIQPDVFEPMLRYIYTRQVSLSSVDSALRLLQAAHKYHLPELSSRCLTYISKNLSPCNVLSVLDFLSQCEMNCDELSKSHPTIVSESQMFDRFRNELVFTCYQIVDCNADAVLQSEAFETLKHDIMVDIVKRDTLEVSSESVVFDAIMRWACRACKRQRKELTPENKCLVLGKALFLVRYLLMTPEEFLRGPVSHDVLSRKDKDTLLSRISDESSTSPVALPDCWSEWNIASKRRSHLLSMTSPCSDRSQTSGTSPSECINKSAKDRKKKSMSKKFLNGVGDLVVLVIHILD